MPNLVVRSFQAVKRIRDAGMTVLIVRAADGGMPRDRRPRLLSCRLESADEGCR